MQRDAQKHCFIYPPTTLSLFIIGAPHDLSDQTFTGSGLVFYFAPINTSCPLSTINRICLVIMIDRASNQTFYSKPATVNSMQVQCCVHTRDVNMLTIGWVLDPQVVPQGSHLTWKTLNFVILLFQAWKIHGICSKIGKNLEF